MSKKWLYLLMVTALVIPLVLTACGGSQEPEAPEPEAPAAEPTKAPAAAEPTKAPAAEEEAPMAEGMYEDVDPSGQEVLWWHNHTRSRQEGLDQMVEDFNNSNEWGIQVAAEYAGQYDEIYDKMIAAISADDPTLMPTLTVGYANSFGKYQLSDALVDMDEFVDSSAWGLTEEEQADFFPGIFASDVAPIFGDGHFRLGFPPNRSMLVMFYNQDWLNELGYDEPPKSWAEFKEVACAATDPDAGTVGFSYTPGASLMAGMIFSRHGDYALPDGSAFTFTNDTVKETVQYMKELDAEGCAEIYAERYGDQTEFGNARALFAMSSSSGLPYYDQAVIEGEQGEFLWSVAPLPYMDGGDEPVQNVYGGSIAVPQTTPEQELASWLFIKWLTEPEQLARWVKMSNYFPVRDSVAAEIQDYFDENPAYKDAFDLLEYGTFEAQWCPCYEEVRRSMSDAWSAILDGADIDETLAQLEADANASLAENLPGGVLPVPDLWGQVQVAGKLVVSSDPNYAPQSFLNDSGELDGFDIDVSKAVADRLGVDVEFVTPDWDLITAGNWGGRWDISIGSMTPTEARAEVLSFTDAYYYTPAVFAVHTDNTDIASPDDLSGKKVGLGTATTYESYLDGTLSIMGGEIMYDPPSGVTVQPYSTDVEAIEDLILGDGVRLDAVMTAAPTVQNAIDEGLPLKYVGTPAFYEPLAFALDKARGPSSKMVDELNDILADLHEDGTLSEISMKWYGVDITTLIVPGEGAAPPAVEGDAGFAVMPGGFLEKAMAGEYTGTEVTVDGPFTNPDDLRFAESMEAFEEATGITVNYIGDKEFEARLSIAVDAGDAPDIADFPQPGKAAGYARQGHIVDPTEWISEDWLEQQYNQSWLDMAQMEGQTGGVWHRFNGKSLVWYPKDDFEAAGYEIPETWDDLLALTQTIADDGDTAWCIGIQSGAATGWVATDWTEEMMMRTTSLENYDAWVAGELPFASPEVKKAIETWGEIWFNADYVFGGTDTIVSTFFGDSPAPMFEDPPKCWLHRQGNFITGFFPEGAEAGVDYDFFYLPPVDDAYGKPFLVAGDMMAMFNDRPEVRALMEYFTTPQSASGWLQNGGALAAHQTATPEMYGVDLERGIAGIVNNATAFRFDGSDLMPGEVGAGSFWTGMTDYVSGLSDLDTALAEIDASWPR